MKLIGFPLTVFSCSSGKTQIGKDIWPPVILDRDCKKRNKITGPVQVLRPKVKAKEKSRKSSVLPPWALGKHHTDQMQDWSVINRKLRWVSKYKLCDIVPKTDFKRRRQSKKSERIKYKSKIVYLRLVYPPWLENFRKITTIWTPEGIC